MKQPHDIDSYLASFPTEIRLRLQELRETILKAAPMAKEVISYGMPAFRQNGILVYFAVHKNHIGFYPTPSAVESFRQEFSHYKWSKGAVQFPIDEPLPLEMVARIVKFRVGEDLQEKIKGGS